MCFGIEDEKYGQVVGAAVVLKGEADGAELRARCRESLADFKVPKRPRIYNTLIHSRRAGDSV